MIRQSNHFTSRIYNRRFAGQVIAIVDSYVAGPIEAAEIEEQAADAESILTRDELEREGYQFTGERDWAGEREERYRREEQEFVPQDLQWPDRYGWEQYSYRGYR
tara:strand:- start:924 stop:1238 length:315 start_codon:yes stop_codon:yes gene_type:complete